MFSLNGPWSNRISFRFGMRTGWLACGKLKASLWLAINTRRTLIQDEPSCLSNLPGYSLWYRFDPRPICGGSSLRVACRNEKEKGIFRRQPQSIDFLRKTRPPRRAPSSGNGTSIDGCVPSHWTLALNTTKWHAVYTVICIVADISACCIKHYFLAKLH